jgi:hypothetical protein
MCVCVCVCVCVYDHSLRDVIYLLRSWATVEIVCVCARALFYLGIAVSLVRSLLRC